jgi:uncharacterized membrane protein YccF (DUF307 family)
MKLLGNIIWMIFGGFLTCLEYIAAGVALCLTIVGIPFGFQCFKLGLFVLMPFGQKAVQRKSGSGLLYTIMNIIWFFIGGIWLALTHLILGIIFAITIIGLPFAKQHFKLMGMALSPFGRDIITD